MFSFFSFQKPSFGFNNLAKNNEITPELFDNEFFNISHLLSLEII